MRIADQMLAELEQEAAATRRVLERVTQQHLAWRPHAKSMSLGQLAQHVATIPGNVARGASIDVLESPGFVHPEATSAAELLTLLDQSLAQARDLVSGMDDERMMATWRLTKDGRDILAVPRMAFLRSVMLNHWYHHRGQLLIYLRMHDVPVPSVYGPTADENPFAQPVAAG